MSMAANMQIISNPISSNIWDTLSVTSFDDILETFDTMSFKIEEFKYDAESRTLFGYLALDAPSNGEPLYPQRVCLYRNGEDVPRVKSDKLAVSSWPKTLITGETYMQYIDSITTPQPININLYPTRKLRDFWFAMYRSTRSADK